MLLVFSILNLLLGILLAVLVAKREVGSTAARTVLAMVFGLGMLLAIGAAERGSSSAAPTATLSQIDGLRDLLVQVRDNVSDVRRSVVDLRSGIEGVRGDLGKVQGTVADLKSGVERLRGEVSEIHGDVNDLRKQFADVPEKLTELSDKISGLQKSRSIVISLTGSVHGTFPISFNAGGIDFTVVKSDESAAPPSGTIVYEVRLAPHDGEKSKSCPRAQSCHHPRVRTARHHRRLAWPVTGARASPGWHWPRSCKCARALLAF